MQRQIYSPVVLAGAGLFLVMTGGSVQAADCNLNGIPDLCDVDCQAPGCAAYACGGSYDVDPADGIPDECEGLPVSGTFGPANFAEGFSINLETDAYGRLQRGVAPKPLPNLWVAASGRGTVVRINTDTGEVVGEYFTAPEGRGRLPSRSAVNLDGEVWVANRAEDTEFNAGSVARIGLVLARIIHGQWRSGCEFGRRRGHGGLCTTEARGARKAPFPPSKNQVVTGSRQGLGPMAM